MQAFSVEKSIIDGDSKVKKLFNFIHKHATNLDAYEMEQTIFSMLMGIGHSAMMCYFGEVGTGDVGHELKIDEESVFKRQSGLTGRDYFSVFGKIKVPRTCYRRDGEAGIMPLDAQINFPERCYSYLLQEWMDLFSIRQTFGESQISLEKLLGIKVSQSRFEVVNQESGDNYDTFYDTKEPPGPETEGDIQVLGFDGKGVPVIKKEAAKIKARRGKGEKRQKKKEALVGVSYTTPPKQRTPEQVAENLIYPEKIKQKKQENKEIPPSPVRAMNVRRMASLERSKKEVMEELFRDAEKRDSDHNRQWVVVMDGALHLWSLVGCVLKGVDYTGILDIIHVVEYLWEAANVLNGEKSTVNSKWVHDKLLAVLQGRVGRVIGGLKQILTKRKDLKASQVKVLKKVINYFENHRQWMKYDEYLKAGYPIGTGVVESACGHTVKDRMEGAGRRWSIKGAESTLLLRAVYTSNDWDAYWQANMKLNRIKKYGKILDLLNSADDYSKDCCNVKLAG